MTFFATIRGERCPKPIGLGLIVSLDRNRQDLCLDFNNEHRYYLRMIQSFQCSDTAALFAGKRIARFANFEAVALRKLQQLNAATALEFLRVPPGNMLEAKLAAIFGAGWEAHPHKSAIRDATHHRLWNADYGKIGDQRVVIKRAVERAGDRREAAKTFGRDFGASAARYARPRRHPRGTVH